MSNDGDVGIDKSGTNENLSRFILETRRDLRTFLTLLDNTSSPWSVPVSPRSGSDASRFGLCNADTIDATELIFEVERWRSTGLHSYMTLLCPRDCVAKQTRLEIVQYQGGNKLVPGEEGGRIRTNTV